MEESKEVKQESLLPSVESIITKHSRIFPLSGGMADEVIIDYKAAIKEAMELTRKLTLELVSEEATAKIEHDEDFQWAEIEYHSILSLNDSPKLKIH